MATLTFRDPSAKNKNFLNFLKRAGLPVERGGGDPEKNFGGLRTSTTFFPLNTFDSWVTIPLNHVERRDTNASASPFTVSDSGFYVVGYDIDYKSSEINDFKLKARVFSELENEEIISNSIRTLERNKVQTEFFNNLIYLSKGDVLSLQTFHGSGELLLEYAALYAFRIDDEYDDVPITPYIKAFWYLNESNGNRQDRLSNFELSAKNNPGSVNEVLNKAVIFNSSSLQALFNNDLNPLDYSDGFTITGTIRLEGAQNSYATLAGRWKGNNNNLEDQFLLYHDHVTNKFIFAFRQENNVYKFLKSKDIFDSDEFNNVSVVYNKLNESVSLYLNGSLQQSLKTNGFAMTSSQPFSVGAYNILENNSLEHSNCSIDQLLVSCSPFASDSIKVLYNHGDALDFEELLERESLNGLGTGSGSATGGGANSADQISFDNTEANLSGNPTNVQTALERIDSVVDGLTSSTFLSYKQSFFQTDWQQNPTSSLYEITIPASTHSLPNPCNFQVAKESGGKVIFDTTCIIEVDVGSKDITIKVNSVPDGRFLGLITAISI